MPVEFPLPPDMTRVLGIHASDIIIRTAIDWGLQDVKANPWLLDYCFASLPQDAATARQYGQKTVDEAKRWFLATNIRVVNTPVLDEASLPAVSVTLQGSAEVESEATTADTHSFPFEENDRTWPALATLGVVGYEASTGILQVDLDDLPVDVFLGAGMTVVDGAGKTFTVDAIEGEGDVLILPEGSKADFRNGAIIKGARPAWLTNVESSSFRETYRIGCHVAGEPAHLTWLHSLVVFVLLRYREHLLEARGLERTTFNSTDFAAEPTFEGQGQNIFGRYLTVTGFIRQYWPKVVAGRIDVVGLDPLRVSGSGGASVRVADAGVDPQDQLWIGNLDSITVPRK